MTTAFVFTDEPLPQTLVGAVFEKHGVDLEAKPPGEQVTINDTVVRPSVMYGDFYRTDMVDGEFMYVVEARTLQGGEGSVVLVDDETIRTLPVVDNTLSDWEGVVRYL